VAVVFGSIGGCGDDRLVVSPVRGKVVYQGQGIPSTVILFPVDPQNEIAARMRPSGFADAAGEFEVKTYVTGDGAPPGKYRVSIIAPAGRAPKGTKDGPGDGAGQATVGVPLSIVKKYANVDTAGIEIEVKEGENNLEPFELKM
jgi:hypothetical protein